MTNTQNHFETLVVASIRADVARGRLVARMAERHTIGAPEAGEVSSYMILMAAIVAAAVVVAPQIAGVITDQGNAVVSGAGGAAPAGG